MNLKEHLRSMVQRIRQAKGWTAGDLAEQLGVSESLISNAQNPNSRVIPRLALIEALAELAAYSDDERHALRVAVAQHKLDRTDGPLHERMMRDIPKTRHDALLADLYDYFAKRDGR